MLFGKENLIGKTSGDYTVAALGGSQMITEIDTKEEIDIQPI